MAFIPVGYLNLGFAEKFLSKRSLFSWWNQAIAQTHYPYTLTPHIVTPLIPL
ncbi:hypothetical protein [Nostoc sp. PCC 7107]|uniref:hypothetical protein n=1 Tax=Nostoc sp. PCC 7107 TaxID=317936 RepID=UPI0003016B5D|nr:hypothetical protein [Nostoc sp. PCC 7107]